MMDCEFCARKFSDTMNGLTELTLHKIVDHPKQVNGEKPKLNLGDPYA